MLLMARERAARVLGTFYGNISNAFYDTDTHARHWLFIFNLFFMLYAAVKARRKDFAPLANFIIIINNKVANGSTGRCRFNFASKVAEKLDQHVNGRFW